tara:strand:+ start:6984 stop:9041 length:2058 start_codon:yes stop_codon:yes gene_type:complete
MVDRLRVTELDFDTIKNNLKSFLQQQDEFSDYDFDGSGMSVLLDILSYNTHYNAYYLNMVANEAFLDTALLRESAVSHAKTLGYTPHSKTSPTATITLTANVANLHAGTCTVEEGYSFLSDQIDGKSFNFVVLKDTTVTKTDRGEYIFTDLPINEGQLVTNQFTFIENSNPKQVFTLPDKDIDTTTIKVTVQDTSSNTSLKIYNKVDDTLNVDGTSEVFFLNENRDGNFEIYFGNNNVGRKLGDGSTVSVSYLVTNGTAANKANNFVQKSSLTDSNGEDTTITLTPISAASGGSDKESVDSIKFSAPNQFTTQNRLVTKKDYETTILREVPSIDSISVWGGEENVPVVYGRVFVSLKPKDNFFVSESEKDRIIDNIIKPKAIIGIEVELVDPDFTFILPTTNIIFDRKKTTLSDEAFKNAVRSSIISYNSTNLSKFNSKFSLSKLSKFIDDTDTNAILGSETSIRLQKRITPTIGTDNYTIDFGEKLKRGTTNEKLVSSQFGGFDESGTARIVQFEEVPQSSTGVSRITVENPGFGYTEAPDVTIIGDGVNATAFAEIEGGEIRKIILNNRGVDYTTATVLISGGNGIGGEATASVDSRNGTIRSVFFDTNGNRQIINDSIGEIDYELGIITINPINITSVTTSDGLLRFTIGSESGVVESIRNNIVTIDVSDSTAITTTLEAVE